MANKSVVVKPKKKKKNKCCGCLLAILITFVVLLVGIFATGWFVGDYFTRQYIDMGIGDVLGAYMDIRTVSKKNLDINEFTEADAAGFEDALKDQLYIKSSVEIPYDEIFDAMLGDVFAGGGVESASVELDVRNLRNSFLMDVVRDHGSVTVESESAAGGNALFDIIMPLLTRDNIDLERLEQHTDQTVKKLTFTDKQLAGFLSKLIRIGAEKGLEDNIIKGVDNRVILDNVQIASVNISGTQAAPQLAMTLQLQTREIARGVVDTVVLGEMIPADFGWAVNFAVGMLLPKETYAAVELTLGDNPNFGWRINGLNDEKMARINKLVSNVGKAADTDLDIDSLLDGVADAYILPYVTELNSYLDYSEAAGGKISADLFGTVLSLTGLNQDKAEADQILSNDLYFTMKALLLSEPEVNRESAFRDQYLTLTGSNAGEVLYRPADFSDTDKYRMVDYQEAFMKELRDKFLLSEDVAFSEIASLFGIGGDSSGDSNSFIEKINFSGDEMLQLAKRPDASNKLILTDRMMGVLFDQFLGTILGDQPMLQNLNPAISHVTLKKLGGTGAVHNWIEAAFTVDIGGAVDDPLMGALIDALLPGSTVMLTVEIDITPDKGDDFYGDGKIRYNDLSDADTMRLLDIIHKFAPGTDLAPSALLGQIEPQFRSVIAEMFKLLPGIELGKSAQLDGIAFGGIEVGSVFEIAAKQLTDLAAEPTDPTVEREAVSAEELRNIIVALWDINDAVYQARPANDDYGTFMNEIKDKFYLNDTFRDSGDSVLKPLSDFDDLMKVVDPASFSDENFRILPDANSNQPSLVYDTRSLDELRVFLSDRDFGAIMKNELVKRENSGADLEGFTKIESVRISPVFEWDGAAVANAVTTDAQTGLSPDGMVSMILSVDVSQFLSDGDSMYLNLLPKGLFVTLEFDISENHAVAVYADDADEQTGNPAYHYYEYRMKLNEMEYAGTDYESLMKMIRLANGGNNPIEIDSVAREVGKALYEQLSDLRTKLGESNLMFSAQYLDPQDNNAGMEYGFSLGSMFHFLESTDQGGKLNAAQLQVALQGMYAYDADHPNNNSYRAYGATRGEHIVFNPVDDEDRGYDTEIIGTFPNMQVLVTLIDSQFGYQLKTGGALIPLAQNPFRSGSGFELVQFDASAAGGESRLTVTFEVQLNNFISEGSDGARGVGYQRLAPDAMYFSFEMMWEAAGGYQLVTDSNGNAFTINQMNPEECEQLFLLIGYDTTGLNNQLADCVGALESMTQVAYGNNEVLITLSQMP